MPLQVLNYTAQPNPIPPGLEAKRREDRHWFLGLLFSFLGLSATFFLITMTSANLSARLGVGLCIAELGLALAGIVWTAWLYRRSKHSWSFARGAFIGAILAPTAYLMFPILLKFFF